MNAVGSDRPVGYHSVVKRQDTRTDTTAETQPQNSLRATCRGIPGTGNIQERQTPRDREQAVGAEAEGG